MTSVEAAAPVLDEARVREVVPEILPPEFELGGDEPGIMPVPGLSSLPPRDDAPPASGSSDASSPSDAGGPDGRAPETAARDVLRRSTEQPSPSTRQAKPGDRWRPVSQLRRIAGAASSTPGSLPARIDLRQFRGRPAQPAPTASARPVAPVLRRAPGEAPPESGKTRNGPPADALRRGDKLPPRDLAAMREDVNTIVGYLQQQILPESDERSILTIIRGWANRDDTPGEGSRYLDAFLLQLKTRGYTRRTARSGWVEQHSLVFDDLWSELEDDRLEEFKSLLARSQHQKADGPSEQQAESIYSFIGKREAIGLWGTLKGMGTTIVGGTVDTVIWATWKQTGEPLGKVLDQLGIKAEFLKKAPQITPFLEKNFDDTAKILGDTMAVDIHEPVDLGITKIGTYELGTAGGKVVGGLTMAGAGNAESVGATAATGMKVVGAIGTAQAADGLIDTVAKLRKGDPKTGAAPLSWSEIVSRADLWAQLAGVIGGATGAADVKSLVVKLGVPAAQIGLLVTAFDQVDNDPRYRTAEQRHAQKVELFTQIVVQGATLADTANTERKQRKAPASSSSSAGGSGEDPGGSGTGGAGGPDPAAPRGSEELFGPRNSQIGNEPEPIGIGREDGADLFGPANSEIGAEPEPVGIGRDDGAGLFGPANSEIGPDSKPAPRVTEYGTSIKSRGRPIERHEVLQNAFLKAIGKVSKRAKGYSKYNTVIELPPDLHRRINQLQAAAIASTGKSWKQLSAMEVVEINLDVLRQAGIPEATIQAVWEDVSELLPGLR